MWRSVFLAVGITLCILGLECLFVEKAVLASGEANTRSSALVSMLSTKGSTSREVVTKEWMPWSFMSAGAVIILYTLTLKKQVGPPPG
jgi:hypothetical protein